MFVFCDPASVLLFAHFLRLHWIASTSLSTVPHSYDQASGWMFSFYLAGDCTPLSKCWCKSWTQWNKRSRRKDLCRYRHTLLVDYKKCLTGILFVCVYTFIFLEVFLLEDPGQPPSFAQNWGLTGIGGKSALTCQYRYFYRSKTLQCIHLCLLHG